MATLIVVAGPPGGGKSTALGVPYFLNLGIPYFNIDERCRQLHGSARKIPPNIRQQANNDLRTFCEEHILGGQSFAFETTLRADFAIRTALDARTAGFETEMHYVAAPVETHIERVTARAVAGGHAASEPRLREMYASSMSNLPKAMDAFSHSFLYDGSGQEMVLQLEIQRGQIVLAETPLASWIERGLEAFKALHREPQ
jgi:predicted ABC-type ATPase